MHRTDRSDEPSLLLPPLGGQGHFIGKIFIKGQKEQFVTAVNQTMVCEMACFRNHEGG